MALCTTRKIQSHINDRACKPPQYTKIRTSEQQNCYLHCVHIRECKATFLCLMFSLHAPTTIVHLLKPNVRHIPQFFEYPCTKLVPTNDGIGACWVYEWDRVKAYVARAFVDNDLILGKLIDSFHCINLVDLKQVEHANRRKLWLMLPVISHGRSMRLLLGNPCQLGPWSVAF